MINFRQSRFKLALVTLLFAAWALALGFMAFVTAYLDGLWPYVGLSALTPLALAFAIAAFMSAMGFLHPATITLDSERLVFQTWRYRDEIARADIADFLVLSPTSALRSPACEKKAGPRKYVSFGRNWESRPEEMVGTMKDALSPLP